MRAIILAAGMGTRLQPFSDSIPKALLKVENQPLIERQIECLREIGVAEVVVITGYMAHKLHYLHAKYGVKLINNPDFSLYNNLYSMYLAREYLPDSYVLESDVYLTRNFLQQSPTVSTYFSGLRQNFANEWILSFAEDKRVSSIKVGDGTGYIMSGVSYWTGDAGEIIRNELEQAIARNVFKDLLWDEIIKNNLNRLDVRVAPISGDDWAEIDSVFDLKKLNEMLREMTSLTTIKAANCNMST